MNGIQNASTGTITIPTIENIDISKGDYIVEGTIKDDFNFDNLMKKYQVFKVLSVDDNRKGGLPHFKIGVAD